MDQFDEKDSTPFDIEETIDELEYELGYMVIGCDFNGDCLLEHGFDFFAEEGCTNEMKIENICDIWRGSQIRTLIYKPIHFFVIA